MAASSPTPPVIRVASSMFTVSGIELADATANAAVFATAVASIFAVDNRTVTIHMSGNRRRLEESSTVDVNYNVIVADVFEEARIQAIVQDLTAADVDEAIDASADAHGVVEVFVDVATVFVDNTLDIVFGSRPTPEPSVSLEPTSPPATTSKDSSSSGISASLLLAAAGGVVILVVLAAFGSVCAYRRYNKRHQSYFLARTGELLEPSVELGTMM